MADLQDVRVTQAAQLLGQGIKPVEVAGRTGFSESQLSTMINHDVGFQNLVRAKLTAATPASHRIDERLEKLEERVWKGIDDNFSFFNKPELLINLAKTVNGARRRSEGETKDQSRTETTVVNIELPMFVIQQIQHMEVTKNTNNEVIEVSGQTMITADSSKLIEEATAAMFVEEVTLPPVSPEIEISQLRDSDFESVEL